MQTKQGSSEDVRRRILDVLVASIDDDIDGEELARRVHFGRFYFQHIVKVMLGESPGAFRRRLLLERAAGELTSTSLTVSAIAFDSGYSSVEAFAHAFRRAFGTSPLAYRAVAARDHRLDAPNGVHYVAPGGLTQRGTHHRRPAMDLTDRLVEHDNWLIERLLTCAEQLGDAELDQPVVLSPPSVAFTESSPSIRTMLNRLVLAKEMWVAATSGHVMPVGADTSIEGMRRRLREAGAAFAQLVSEIRQRNAWDTAYVDATQQPPNTSTFGASVAHVLAWDAARREIVTGALIARGIDPVSLDPVQWEFAPDELKQVAGRATPV